MKGWCLLIRVLLDCHVAVSMSRLPLPFPLSDCVPVAGIGHGVVAAAAADAIVMGVCHAVVVVVAVNWSAFCNCHRWIALQL